MAFHVNIVQILAAGVSKENKSRERSGPGVRFTKGWNYSNIAFYPKLPPSFGLS